jgi:hypothetical protein
MSLWEWMSWTLHCYLCKFAATGEKLHYPHGDSGTPSQWTLNTTKSAQTALLDCRPFGRKHLIEAWLSRSGNLPLSIQIYYIDDSDDPWPISDDFVDIFIPFSSRWSNLHLDLPQPPIERLVCNSSVSTPNLETLALSIQDDIDPLAVTQTAIRLQKITVLRGFLTPSYLKIPWSQLTELRSAF